MCVLRFVRLLWGKSLWKVFCKKSSCFYWVKIISLRTTRKWHGFWVMDLKFSSLKMYLFWRYMKQEMSKLWKTQRWTLIWRRVKNLKIQTPALVYKSHGWQVSRKLRSILAVKNRVMASGITIILICWSLHFKFQVRKSLSLLFLQEC